MSTGTGVAAPPRAVGAAAPLLGALCDLKRVTSPALPASLATRLFEEAWDAVVGGAPLDDVALAVAADAVAATQLSAVRREDLLGVPEARADEIVRDAVAAALGDDLPAAHAALTTTLERRVVGRGDDERAARRPAFVGQLAGQPRAGATAPGQRRVLLHPQETHADHCLAVAAGAVVLALEEGCAPGMPFLSGLAHHLHNATFPDAGFAGEVLLGDDLDAVFAAHRDRALAQLPEALRPVVASAAALALELDTPAARCVVAADTLDRVLELEEGCAPGMPFLSGLAHHLHNATFPDAGFAGEVLLGDDLDAVFAAHRERALAQLPEALRPVVARAAALALELDTPAARCVVAADTLDRVLELEWHARSAAFTLDVALDDLELVHAGPLQAFGEATLQGAGLR